MPVPQSFADIQELLKSIKENPRIVDGHVTSIVSVFLKKDPSHLNRYFDNIVVDLAHLGRANVISELKSRFLATQRPELQEIVCRRVFDHFARKGLLVDDTWSATERKDIFWNVCAALQVERKLKNSQDQTWNNTRANLLDTFVVSQADSEIFNDLLKLPRCQKLLRNPDVLARLLYTSTSPNVLKDNPAGYRRVGALFSAHRLAELALRTPREPFIDLFLLRSPKEQKKIIEKCSGYKTKIGEFESLKQKNDLLEKLQSALDQKNKTPKRRM